MRIVDYTIERRSSRLAPLLGDEYITITDGLRVPEGDYYLVPSAWWYKDRRRQFVDVANEYKGRIVLMDYGREMEQIRKNMGGIKPDYVAVLENYCPNNIPTFPFSLPEFDPHPNFKRKVEKGLILVTLRKTKVDNIKRFIDKYGDKKIIWKLRQKDGYLIEPYSKLIEGREDKIVWPHYKDYNKSVSIVEEYAAKVEWHVNFDRLSLACQEMVRYGVPTYVWNGRKRVSHPRIYRTKEIFGDVPKDWCTQNLIRNLRENLNSHR